MTTPSNSKFGHCSMCPKTAPQVRLYGGLCAHHLGHPEDDNRKESTLKPLKKDDQAQLLRLFFESQVARCPRKCENCGKRLGANPPGGLKSYVCHIVPKKHFKSVMLHPANVWFGCLECHHNYDDRGWTKAATMAIWPTVIERFKEFMELIKDGELRHLPILMRELTGR